MLEGGVNCLLGEKELNDERRMGILVGKHKGKIPLGRQIRVNLK
jgi:hypothetical protein